MYRIARYSIPSVIYRSASTLLKAVERSRRWLYFHGGGWVVRDEGEAYAELLREAGGEAVERYERQIHGFVNMCGVMDEGRRAIEEAAAQLRRAFGTKSYS